jgi:hypothetical protein
MTHTVVRGVVAFVAAVAAMYFVSWTGGAFLYLLGIYSSPLTLMLGVVAAIAAARYVWRWTDSLHGGLARSIVLGALVTGGVGFCGGFFGPILLTPDANQGPLLGIFITGPLGFVLGGVGGAVRWRWRGRDTAEARNMSAR